MKVTTGTHACFLISITVGEIFATKSYMCRNDDFPKVKRKPSGENCQVSHQKRQKLKKDRRTQTFSIHLFEP